MKHLKYLFFLPASLVLLAVSCSKDSSTTSTDESGDWIKRSSLNGDARYEAASFVIEDTGYIVTGFNGTDRYNDTWGFTPNSSSGQWLQKAQFPGAKRNSAVGFSVNKKGYVTTGYDGARPLKDTWEYTPGANGGSWVQRADFPEPVNPGTGLNFGRYEATAWSLTANGVAKGYVGFGLNSGQSAQKDVYAYNPANNTWAQVASPGGDKRSAAAVFVNANKAYIISGLYNNSSLNDMWMYNPDTDTWTEMNKISNISTEGFDDDYTDIVRYNAASFVMNNGSVVKGYLTVGVNGSLTNKTWEYDFATDRWLRKTYFEKSTRTGAVGFTMKGRGFVTTGSASGLTLDDLYEFDPTKTRDDNNN